MLVLKHPKEILSVEHLKKIIEIEGKTPKSFPLMVSY